MKNHVYLSGNAWFGKTDHRNRFYRYKNQFVDTLRDKIRWKIFGSKTKKPMGNGFFEISTIPRKLR